MVKNRYADILNGSPPEVREWASRFHDAALYAISTRGVEGTDVSPIFKVAAWVAAPMLVSYVHWLLVDARKRGLKRLYFLSRDGQILLEIAKRLEQKLRTDIELRYLYASRQSWNRALSSASVQGWVWDDLPPRFEIDTVYQRLGVSREEGLAAFAAVGEPEPAGAIGDAERRRLRDLFQEARFEAALKQARVAHRETLCGYLEQEDVFSDAPAAIVDIGWIGTLHETLCNLCTEKTLSPLHGYFFGLKSYETPFTPYRHGFAFEASAGEPVDLLLPDIGLMVVAEVFCAADHGTVAGFEREGDRVQPVCMQEWAEDVKNWGLLELRAAVFAVAERLEPPAEPETDLRAMRLPIKALLQAFWLNPKSDEAEVWGRFPWDAGQGAERVSKPLCEPYSVADVTRIISRQGLRRRHVFWVEGGIARSPMVLRQLLKACYTLHAMGMRLARQLKRGMRN